LTGREAGENCSEIPENQNKQKSEEVWFQSRNVMEEEEGSYRKKVCVLKLMKPRPPLFSPNR